MSERYSKTRLLGRGGMGEVWLARDSVLQRDVALKFLLGGDEPDRKRFRREAQLAARLSHPNIVAIYDVGDDFIAMEYVPGRTLSGASLPLPRAVDVLRVTALAVHAAHENGVIHRDLKPGNILLDEQGVPHVTDFGLARSVGAASSLTASGMLVGTPAYMSPEQARGDVRGTDARSDVYSLGATLYELVTGHAPFTGSSAMDVLVRVLHDEPDPPRRHAPRLPVDVATIIAKAMDKDPARRYATARDLADDLRRFLAGEPIRAHPPSVFYRVRKALARRARALGAAAALAVAAAVLLVVQARRASQREASIEELNALWSELLLARETIYQNHLPPDQPRRDMSAVLARLDGYLARRPRDATAWYVRGRGRMFLDDYDGACADARHALELDATFAAARLLLARALLESYRDGLYRSPLDRSRGEESLKLAEAELARAGPPEGALASRRGLASTRDDDVTLLLARALRRCYVAKEVDGAREDLAASPLRGRSADAMSLIANWTVDRDQREVLLRETVKIAPHHARGWFDYGLLMLQTKEWARARACFDRALEIRPDFPGALVSRGVARGYLGDLAGDIDDCTRALELDASLLTARFNRGWAHLEHGDPREAIADFDAVLAARPDDVESLYHRALARQRSGDARGATEDARRALAVEPRHASSWVVRAAAAFTLGDIPAQVEAAAKAVELEPKSAQAHYYLALGRGLQGDADAELAGYTKALECDARHPESLMNRAWLFQRRGAWASVRADCDRLLEFQPRHVKGRIMRAAARRAEGDLRGALADLDAAVEADANDAEAVANRAQLRSMTGDDRGALVDYDRALAVSPGRPEYLANRGAVRMRVGDFAGAARDFEEALARAPRDAPWRADIERRLQEARGRQ